MSKIIRFVIVIGLFANHFVTPLRAAQAAAPQQQDQTELEAVADIVSRLDELAYFEELGQPMPFTTVSPSDERALRLGGLFDDLAGRIAEDDRSADHYSFGDVSVHVTHWPLASDLRLSFTASRVITVPVTLSLEDPASATSGLCNDGIDNNIADPDGADQDDSDCSYIGNFLNGGGIKTNLALSGEFMFTQEISDVITSPESTMTLTLESAENDSNIATFTDQFGFVDVLVSGPAVLDEAVSVAFNDPDGDGRITSDEWFNTAIEDLTTVAFEPNSSAVYSLSLEPENPLDQIEAGTIGLDIDRSVSPEWPGETTILIPEPLRVFANIDSDVALAGLNSYAVSLNTALLAGEVQLPFLDMRFSDAFMPGQPILELVKQQTDALVICGKTDTLPPTGDPIGADPLYCQAITIAEPTEVITWTLENFDLIYSDLLTKTVGVSPKENVRFDRSDFDPSNLEERPRARVEYIDGEGESHVVFPRVLSANQLADELSRMTSSNGSGEGQVTMRYLPDKSALMYDITMKSDTPMTTTQFAFADQLRQETNLANLRSTETSSPEVTFTNVVVSSTFGILLMDGSDLPPLPASTEICDDDANNDDDGLMDDYDPDCPAPNGPEDRFLIAPSDNPVIQVDDLALIGADSVALMGNIGFLGVLADGPFTLTKGNHGQNLLEIELLPSTIETNYSNIENAIRIREFLADTGSVNRYGQVQSAANISTTAELSVQSDGLGQELTGMVGIKWNLAASDAPSITMDTDFANDLRPFDIAPTLAGYHTPTSTEPLTSTLLIDMSRNFVEDFGGGIASGDVLNLELMNLTDGSSCASFEVEPHALTCVAGYTGTLAITGTLAGGEGNYWAPGDEYEIQGDSQSLGNLILDSLFGLASQMQGLDLANPAKAEFASTLPVIGLSPRDLTTQFDAIAAATVDIRSGTGDAEIVCNPPEKNDPESANLSCRAVTDIPDIIDATWSISAGHGVITPTELMTVTLSVSVPEAERDDFEITLVFTDTSATTYRATYPPQPINDLSDLRRELEALLSRQYEPGAVDVSFNPQYMVNPSGQGGSVLHLVPHIEIEEQGVRPYRLMLDLGEAELIADDSDSTALSLEFQSQAQIDLGIPLASSVSAYDVLVRDTTWVSLTVTSVDNQIDLQAALGGAAVQVGVNAGLTGTHVLETFTGTHTGEITSTTTLSANLNIESQGLITGTSTILTNTRTITTSTAATCTVAAIGGHLVTCEGSLGGGYHWENGDTFSLTGPSTKRLQNPTVDFSGYNIRPGSTLTNIDKNAACIIELPIPAGSNVLSCSDVLAATDGSAPGDPTPAWDEGDQYEIQGIGAIRLALTSTLAMTETRPLSETTSALTHTFTSPLQDVISATLSVVVTDDNSQGQVLTLTYQLDDLPDGPTRDFTTLLQAFEEAPIDWTMLSLPLELLDGIIEQNLDGQWWGFGVPLVGADLAAGAEVSVSGVKDVIEPIGVGPSADAGVVVLATIQALCSDSSGVITETLRFEVITDTHTPHTCSTLPHAIVDEDVKDLKITFTISETDAVHRPAFDLGLPGLPVTAESDQSVTAETSWTLTVTFGVSRTVGPYVDGIAADELALNSNATFSNSSGITGCDTKHSVLPDSLKSGYRSGGCLEATMGFLPGRLFDNNTAGSSLVLSTTMDLNAEGGILTFGQLLERTGAHTVTVDARANVNVAFIADLDGTRTILPIAGTFHLDFDTDGEVDVPDGIQPAWITRLSYEEVQMNVGSFFGDFVGTMVEDVQDFTAPLQPPIDALSAPVPIINDLSQSLGQGPVSMLTMLEATSGNDLTLLHRLSGLITFVNNLPEDSPDLWIGLGGQDPQDNDTENGQFSLNVERSVEPVCGEETEEKALGTTWTAQECYSRDEISKTWERDLLDNTMETKSGREVMQKINAEASEDYQAGGISLPFLSDSKEIYGLLLGMDATLLRVDLGTLSAGAGFSYSYYTVFVTPVGPIPVEFIVGGEVSISGRFAMGYDTRGLRHALAGESFTGETLLDGIFIDDYDADGNEVPELTFEASFYAGAAVSVYIVKVGLEMGVTFRVDLDLNDPNPDGKMYIDEIMLWRFNPVCLFEFSGSLEFFLRMFVEVDLFLFTARAEWYPFRHTINLFNVKCEPPDPILAQPVPENDPGFLQLNIGTNANLRNLAGDENEKFTVRQLTVTGQGCSTLNEIHEYDKQPGPFRAGPTTDCLTTITGTEFFSGTWVSVVFLGIKQSFFLTGADVDSTVPISASASGGNDVIRLEPGSDEGGNEVPFELNAIIHGGTGNDRITTGGGDDEIRGGEGNDVINAGLGDDEIWAGAGNDKVDANIGNDVIHGGPGDDILNGGPGIDALDGGQDNDRLTGGPGLPPGSDFDDELHDKDDILVGGTGDDVLEGDYGSNYLFGDALLGYTSSFTTFRNSLVSDDTRIPVGFNVENACLDESGDTGGHDTLTGGNEDDYLFGGPKNDSLAGGTGDDYICGNGGHDILDGRRGDDELYGGPGNDQLLGWSGHDLLVGGGGQDLLKGDTGHDALIGDMLQAGNVSSEGSDVLIGGGDNDLMLGDSGLITITDSLSATNSATRPQVLSSIELAQISATETATVTCSLRVKVISGAIDLKADKVVNLDDAGFFEGYPVMDGMVDYDIDGTISVTDTGFINGILIQNGLVDVNGDGVVDADGDLEADNPDQDSGTVLGVAVIGGGNADCLYGEDGTDYLFGGPADDRLFGDAGQDYIEGNSDSDMMRGGDDDDHMLGDNSCTTTGCMNSTATIATQPGADWMFGDSGEDTLYGNAEDDTMRGGIGNDIMYGNSGVDYMYGEADSDQMVGGSPEAGSTDSDDHMWGGAGTDIMTGDNADVVRASTNPGITIGTPGRHVKLLDVPYLVKGTGSNFFGSDTMYGDDGDDYIWGQSGDDTIRGGDGDDYMEGNAGQDRMYGGDGRDDMVGGSGYHNPDGELHELANVWDAGEIEMYGGLGKDIMAGDNAYIMPITSGLGFERAPDRDIKLYDLQIVGGPVVSAEVSGADTMHGGAGDDVMFGQGNGSQPADEADPPDEVDNDRDGRESPESDVFDCLDGFDNDGDGATDVDDPGCSTLIDEDDPWSGDTLYGEDGEDYMEGNHGNDWLFGGAGEDDMIGGGSANDGVIDPDRQGDNLVDGSDIMAGQEEDDVILGDNGVILRTKVNDGWLRLTRADFDLAVRNVQMSHTPEPLGTHGNDHLLGNDGHDDMYGQLGDDYMEGNQGEDAMVGDLGRITNVINDGSNEQVIRSRSPFLESTIYTSGSLLRSVELFAFNEDQGGDGGDDIMLGGDQADSLHGGPGDDLLNGDGDATSAVVDPAEAADNRDNLFGGDGADAIWGGRGNDHLFGGRGNDYLDILPRPEMTVGKKKDPMTLPPDSAEWFIYASDDNYQGMDIIYGGWDRDAMQADVGGPGPTAGDRLLDWVGAYNVYYVCGGAYGEGRITRSPAPHVIEYLQKLAEAGGAAGASDVTGSSGAHELAMVFARDARLNSHPIHDDHPGHFTCELDQSAASADSNRSSVGRLTDSTPAGTQQLTSGCTVPGDYATIQAAVDDPGCDTISLGAGTFTENIRIERPVAIHGQGTEATIVDGGGAGHVFDIQASTELDQSMAMTVTISGLAITNGDSGLYAEAKNVEWDPGYVSAHLYVNVADCIITGNNGSGVRAYAHDFGQTEIHISGTTIDGNLGPGVGNLPGTYGNGTVELVDSTVSHNSGEGIVSYGCGHGLCNAALDVANSTISGNTGSGINNGDVANVTNSTISGNVADYGGGIYSCGTTNLLYSTVTGNSAGDGGGLFIVGSADPYGCRGRVTAGNSIVANSASGADCALYIDTGPWAATFTDAGHNIVEDGTCIDAPSSSLGDPSLGPIADNGGPTLTHALSGDSPAIDAGDNATCPESDQRGRARPIDGDGEGTAICDIGSFEFEPIVFYVTPAGDGDCSSWANACSLQDALGSTGSGDEIWVAEGLYTPGASPEDSFWLPNGAAVFGGFSGVETAREQRDWQTHMTVLSGDLTGDDEADANGVITDTAKIVGTNAYHVVSSQLLNETAVLNGFTITGGDAAMNGGGMRNADSNPTLTNLIFRGNLAASVGGGMFNFASSPMLMDVTFSGNSADFGGGMYNTSSSPTLKDVTFQGNSAAIHGGGMRNWNMSNPTLKGITFQGNSAGEDGGGLGNLDNGNPTLTDVTFVDNTASLGGGMANQANSGTTMVNVIFYGNMADYGGGMFNEGVVGSSLVKMTNTIFSGNRANFDGGAIESRGYLLDLRQVTLANNHADGHGGGLNMLGSGIPGPEAQISNSIFWGNAALHGGQLSNVDPAVPVGLDHVLIQNGCPENTLCGELLVEDPLFMDAEGPDEAAGTMDDDLRLQELSPAVDSGYDPLVPQDELDLDQDGDTAELVPLDILGVRRFYGDRVDMGACEWQESYQFLPVIVR